MRPFWRLAREMLHERGKLAAALVFVFVSAGGLGVGLLSLGPFLKLILSEEGGRSLPQIARDFNAEDKLFQVPPSLIEVLPEGRYEGVVVIVGLIFVLTIVGGLANFLHQYLSQTVTTRTVARVRGEVFRHVVDMPLGRVLARGPSQLVARIIRDTAELQRGFIALTSKMVAHLTKGIAAFLAALWFDPKLTFWAIIVVIPLVIVLRKIGKRIRRGTRGALHAQEHLLRIASESLGGLRAVKANTGEGEAKRRFGSSNDEVVTEELKVRTARAASAPIMETLATFTVGALALVAAKLIASGRLPFDDFILTMGALGFAGASFRPLAGLINEVQAASAPAGRLVELLDERPEVVDDAGRPELAPHRRSIEFDHVILAYPGQDEPALRDVSLNILHGEKIAIVGPNGSGKTTLVSLLPRLLVANRGRVLIDGTDITTVNLRSLRRQIGVVTQETVLFRGSIEENISFGCESANRELVVEAAKRAHADEFIRRIPGGYDADVLEQGASLSGGQRQRLAIARAILRDPTILILDEATSQIDAESEAHINAALEEFCRGRTALLIAHRLSTVVSADRIVVMDEGRIVDQGRHAELLERCELYARLSKTQLVGTA